jgi:hypothetical protein
MLTQHALVMKNDAWARENDAFARKNDPLSSTNRAEMRPFSGDLLSLFFR